MAAKRHHEPTAKRPGAGHQAGPEPCPFGDSDGGHGTHAAEAGDEFGPAPGGGAVVPVGQVVSVHDFIEVMGDSADFVELRDQVAEAIRRRHAPATARNYDYWLGRLERWMGEPTTRFRFRDLPGVALDTLWPIDAQSEAMLMAWLRDITLGPTDPDELAEWLEVTGPMSPSTLTLIVSAIKARTTERQDRGWEPSTAMANVLRGLRRELRERHGPAGAAEPLLGMPHVAAIAEMLAGTDTPSAARDRLVCELHAAGVDGGGITRLRIGSVRAARPGIRAADAAANEALFRETGDVGAKSLVVPGQRRRGGRCDAERVVLLDDHPRLAAALEGYLDHRGGAGPDDALVELPPSNPHQGVRDVLCRLAELAELEWRPARGSWASPAEVAAMRGVIDAGLDWAGQLRRRRDHVMLLVGYLCALRRSELCGLRLRDVRFDGTKAIVTIARSKTDQDAKGVRLPVHRPTGSPRHLDAPALLADWVALMRTEFDAGPDDALFPALNRHGDLLHRAGRPQLRALDPQSWSERLRDLTREARVFGDDAERYDRVSGHSLRRGFVTAAILAGHDPVTIAKQTRHAGVGMIAAYADELRLLEGTDWATSHFGDATMLGGEMAEG